MKKGIIVFGVIALLLLVVGTGVFLSKKTNSSSNQAVLSQTTSNVDLPVLQIFSDNIQIKRQDDTDFSAGVNGEKIPVGTIIKTDGTGRGELLYPSHSVTRIDFNSQMTLKEFSENPNTTNVLLDIGRIWSRVAKLLGKGDSSTTETTTLVASVRGTSYGLGILADGSNKISVGKSTVHVDCNADAFNTDVTVNKKLTTKCDKTLQTLAWDTTEKNDAWFNWNLDQDKKLDQEFGGDTYGDQPTPTPTPKPTLKPTIKPTATPGPTQAPATPSPTPTPTSTSTPTPTATPISLDITNITLKCSSAGQSPCNENDFANEFTISGTAFASDAKLTFYLINNQVVTAVVQIPADSITVTDSTHLNAGYYSSSLKGSYHAYVEVQQGTSDKKYDQTISIP